MRGCSSTASRATEVVTLVAMPSASSLGSVLLLQDTGEDLAYPFITFVSEMCSLKVVQANISPANHPSLTSLGELGFGLSLATVQIWWSSCWGS